MTSRSRAFVVVLLVLTAVPAGVVGAADIDGATTAATEPSRTEATLESTTVTTTGGSAPMADADDVLHRATTLRHLPDRPGEFEAEMTFEIPDPVSGLEVDLPSEAEVTALEDFEATGEGTYRWTGETDAPTIRMTMPADRTRDVGHAHPTALETRPASETATADDARAEGAGEGYTFRDTGDWGVVQIPDAGLTFQKPTSVDIGIAETAAVDGPGVAGSDIAFFGPVTEHERTVDGETITLAVADDADLREDPDEILDALAAASEALPVGANDAEVLVVAVPSDADWGPRGIQYGASDAWVVADAPLDEASNVWLHEYVHARQGFASSGTATDATWFVEAQAEYHAGLLAYEQGLISFGEFEDHLERGERSPYADDVLAEPTTWSDQDTPYAKGALVAGELDRQLRLATDGDRTLADAVRQLNAQGEQVRHADVLAALEAAGGADVRKLAEKYTRTDETPAMWGRFDHGRAFDQRRATIEYGLDAAPIEVAGQPWDRWERGDLEGPAADIGRGDAIAVPAGETVTVPVAIENVDDRAGTADATLQVDGEIVALERRALEAGERATTTLAWTPTRPGVYDVRVGGDRLTVFVRSTPSLTVTDLRVDPEGVDPGDPVTATATVTTADRYPAAGGLEFRFAGGSATGTPIALAPGDAGAVEAELTFDEQGRYEIAAGDRSATVAVGGAPAVVESVPGFGGVAAVVALGLALAVAALGRHGQ